MLTLYIIIGLCWAIFCAASLLVAINEGLVASTNSLDARTNTWIVSVLFGIFWPMTIPVFLIVTIALWIKR